MVDSNFYVENPTNSQMHYQNKPLIGVIDFPDRLPVNRPYNYFEAQTLYNGLVHDVWEQQKHGNPNKVKKGFPRILKIVIGALVAIPLFFIGVKGIKYLITKYKH